MFLIENYDDSSNECGLLKNDVKRLFEDFKKLRNEQNEDYID